MYRMCMAVAVLVLVMAGPLWAATINFTGATDSTFGTATNWDLGRLPSNSTAAPATGDVVGISGDTSNQPVFAGPYSLNGVELTGAAGGASLTGTGTLTLGSGGIVSGSTSGVNTFGTGMTVAQAAVFDITVAAGGTLNFNATLNSSSNSSYRKVTKKGDGTLVMNGSTNDKTYFVLEAGTVKLGAANRFNENDATSFTVNGGTFDLNNYAERIRRLSGTGGTITNSGATVQTLSVRNQNLSTESAGTFAGQITGSLNLEIKSDNLTDVLQLTDASSYTGSTTVNKGTLYVDGSIGGSGVTVKLGTLGGVGSVNTSVAVGDSSGTDDAVLRPGKTGIGSLGIGGLLTLNSDAKLEFQINSDTQTADSLSAQGVNLGDGIATLSLVDLGSAVISGYHAWTLIDNTSAGGVVGRFEGLDEGAEIVLGANTYRITYAGGADHNDVVLTIPEPTTLLLLGSGVALLVRRRVA